MSDSSSSSSENIKEENDIIKPSPPNDKFDLIYWTAFFVGLVILLPWNILITVTGYWDYKYRNVSLDGVDTSNYTEEIPPTQWQKEWQAYLSIAANVPNAIFVCLHALFGYKFGMKFRLIGSQVMMILVFAVIVILAVLDTDSWQYEFLIVNLTTIAFLNVFSAIFQGSFSANLGTFPVAYIGNCVSGAGMGGLVPSIVNVIILSINADFQWAGFYCFLFAEITCFISLALTIYVQKNEFYMYYSDHIDYGEIKGQEAKMAFNFKEDLGLYWEIIQDTWIYLLTTVINFTVTLVVFPAVTSLIVPTLGDPDSDWNTIYFIPVCCFINYNLFDVVGKAAATSILWPSTSKKSQIILLCASIARIAFVPLFMFCNVSPLDRKTDVVFESEIYYIAFIIVLAFTNGYIGNISSMFCPKVVREELSGIASAFNVACLVLGCGIGSVLSAPTVRGL